jgi:lipopolysaccharide/colanic/teichoic acid biosynthesis glycosyltransferase
VKRIFDFVVTLMAIVLLLPLLIPISILVVFSMGTPVFFSQKRIGLNGKPFKVYKFRSMTNEKDEHGNLLPNADRVTKVGNFLRSSSIDELPSLYNILTGDMSLVGPRPLLPSYIDCYSTYHQTRHNIRPGLTGLAQISGRNNITWQARLDLDIDYINKQSFLFDLWIIFRTVIKVLRRSDVKGTADMSIVRLDKDTSYSKEKK